MTLAIDNPARPWVILALVVIFVGSMQTFLNVAVWAYLSEIFPLHMRGFGMSVSVFALWITNGFLSLVDAVGVLALRARDSRSHPRGVRGRRTHRRALHPEVARCANCSLPGWGREQF